MKRKRINLDILPYPIATAYRRIRACHGNDARRLKHILQTAEMTVRFLAVVVLSELREKVKAGVLSPGSFGERTLNNLRRPSFGHWIEIMREGTRLVAEMEESFMPELRFFVFGKKLGSPAQPLNLLNDLVAMRNKFAHGNVPPAEIQKMCDQSEEMVSDVLRALDFFEDYQPYYVKKINVVKRRIGAVRFTHQFWLFAGPYQDPEAVVEERDWHTDSDDLILEKQGGAFLNLQPYLLYLDNEKHDEASGIRSDLYIFNGYENKKQQFNIHYLPCGTSGLAFSSEQFPDDQERVFLTGGLQEYFDVFIQNAADKQP